MNASNPELPTMYVCINSRAYSHYTLFPIREKQAQEEKVIDPKTPAHNSDTRLLTFSQDCEKYINFFPNAEHFSLKLSTVGLKHKNIKLFFILEGVSKTNSLENYFHCTLYPILC